MSDSEKRRGTEVEGLSADPRHQAFAEVQAWALGAATLFRKDVGSVTRETVLQLLEGLARWAGDEATGPGEVSSFPYLLGLGEFPLEPGADLCRRGVAAHDFVAQKILFEGDVAGVEVVSVGVGAGLEPVELCLGTMRLDLLMSRPNTMRVLCFRHDVSVGRGRVVEVRLWNTTNSRKVVRALVSGKVRGRVPEQSGSGGGG